jgi:hypothetical protein
MKDAPFSKHPETGIPVRRVISGGFGITRSAQQFSGGGNSCGHGCGCH